jgi:oligopeptide transport system permease protein
MKPFSPLVNIPMTVESIEERPNLIKVFFRHPLSLIGFILFIFLAIAAIFYPMFSQYDYETTHLALKNEPPSKTFYFGTDDLGRDICVRTCYGVRISLFVAFTAAIIDMFVGVFWGGMAALIGGITGQTMMRFVDILAALPTMLLVIIILIFIPPSVMSVILALTVTGWLNMARIVRGQVLSIKERTFVKASYAFGASRAWVLTRHIIPNIRGTIIAAITLTIPAAIFLEAFLSFLGLGIQAPVSSLGVLTSDGLPALSYYPWRLAFPAATLCMLTLSFHCMGTILCDLLNPKLHSIFK